MNNLPDFVALKPLAQGNTAEIYDYSSDGANSRTTNDRTTHNQNPTHDASRILKLFRENLPLEPILAEYEKSKRISRELTNTPKTYYHNTPQAYSFSVPKVYGFITYQNRHGIIYEKICGPDMISAMLKAPHKLSQNSQNLAKIHFALHSHDINLDCSVKDKLAADIDATPVLTSSEKSRIKTYLHSLPDGDALLHFDFHPGNILFRPTPYVIDWMTACVGDPCADVARTYLLLQYGELTHANPLLRQSARLFSSHIGKIYLAEYLKLSRLSRTDVEKWLLPVATARLREWITPREQKRLLTLIRKLLLAPIRKQLFSSVK